MTDYNPCQGCEFFNKPYWSVLNPCDSCPKQSTGGYVTTPTIKVNNYLHPVMCMICDEFIRESKYPDYGNTICNKCKAAIRAMRKQLDI